MSDLIHFKPLGSEDAAAISRLQRELFAPEYRERVGEIRDILKNTEEHLVCNLSFGMYDDTKIVAYVFVYIESESLFHRREEEVVYIKEFGVLPGYERYLPRIFRRLAGLWATYATGLPFEAHAATPSLESWRKIQRVFRRYGMTLQTRPDTDSPAHLDYQLMRFDVDNRIALGIADPSPLPVAGWQHRNGLSVTRLSNTRQWQSLKESWDEILSATPDSNVFQSYEFLWQWWKYFGIWNDLCILVLRSGAEVVALAPMMIQYFPIFGRTVRKLAFIGADMEMNRPTVLRRFDREKVNTAVLGYLDAHRSEWDCADIDEQLWGDNADSILRHLVQYDYNVATSETLCPYIELDGSWEQFLASRSRRMRGNLRRLRRRIQESGKMEIRLTKGWPALDAAIDVHCEIESRSWKIDRNLHIARDAAHYSFYMGLAERFSADGHFELRTLELDGRPIASTFGIVDRDSFQSLMIAHDRSYDHLSPGTVLESFELEAMFCSGLRRYEFLGSFLTNKLRWTDQVIETVNIHVYSKTIRLSLFFYVHFVLKRRVKAILKSAGIFEPADRLLKTLVRLRQTGRSALRSGSLDAKGRVAPDDSGEVGRQ